MVTSIAVGSAIVVVGCDTDSDCATNRTCLSHAGSAGKSGGSGNGGSTTGGTVGSGGSSGTSGTAGTMGSGGDGGSGSSSCSGDVSTESACWTNELGVFVSSDSGDDATGNGTKEAPFKTISKGVGAAAGKNVYVCVGAKDYKEETITLNAASDGVRIYGGFECAGWTYAPTRSAQVVSDSNIALRIDGLKKGVYIENVSFQAADATGTGVDASSYGGFVTGSKGVVFMRVALVAGVGNAGANGADGGKGIDGAAMGTPPVAAAAVCENPALNVPGPIWPSESTCGSFGGKGGDAGKGNGLAGGDGLPSEHVAAVENETGKGGLGSNDGAPGKDGDDGMSGVAGTLGTAAQEAGVFSISGFVLADGKAGGAGFAGQGGGGGGASRGSSSCDGAAGGVGGMGGCGGKPGGGGTGGGASVGLFSWASEIVSTAGMIRANAGGSGGAGGKGGPLGLGASGGAGGGKDENGVIGLGGDGGHGGDGGRGGNGSGGTGGPSYAIVYGVTQPTHDADTMLKSGEPGAAGVGGQQVSTTKAPDGSKGAAGAELKAD